MKKRSIYKYILFILAGLTVALNLLALSRKFRNFWADNVYPIINRVVGTVTSPVPLAVGEIIMYLAALFLLLTVFIEAFHLIRPKNTRLKRLAGGVGKSFLSVTLLAILVYTTNWLIPYRSDLIWVSDNERTEFTAAEVEKVYTIIVTEFNACAEAVPRDEKGEVIYDYSYADIADAMRGISGEYTRLEGHYSEPKKALCSAFLDWMGIGGYNYIYTMEPTYNKYTPPMYKPVLLAHEYAHHKGYYKENEGEFLSALALASCDDPLLQYSGYYEMFRYISPEFEKIIYDAFAAIEGEVTTEKVDLYKEFRSHYPSRSQQVAFDIDVSYRKADELYKSEVSEAMEDTFSEASGKIADKGWEIQGDIIGENSYDGLTLMLLQYYCE